MPRDPAAPNPAPSLREGMCVSLIGMAGAGKSTVGKELARILDWAFLDTDHLIEAVYAANLQKVADALGKEAFLSMEAEIIRSVRIRRCVLATGGSAVYFRESMEHLADLGPVVHLDVPLPLIRDRIACKPDRGLAVTPGQTLEDLFREREELYRRYSSFSLQAASLPPEQCAEAILEMLDGKPGGAP